MQTSDKLRSYLDLAPDGLVAAYLFGSEARGTAGPHSDVDVGVLLRASPPRTLLDQPFALADELTGLMQRPVQLVVLNDAPIDLVQRVLRDGALLIDRDPSARIRFEASARNAYFDLKPFLGRYRRAGLTDEALLAKRLAFIETCVHELQTLANLDRIEHDVREARFVEHTLQLAIQAALDVASHIVSDRRLGEPTSNQHLFTILVGDGWLTAEQLPALRAMAGFRNILVHGYTEVDRAIVKDVVQHRLGDLLELVSTVRARLASPPL